MVVFNCVDSDQEQYMLDCTKDFWAFKVQKSWSRRYIFGSYFLCPEEEEQEEAVRTQVILLC